MSLAISNPRLTIRPVYKSTKNVFRKQQGDGSFLTIGTAEGTSWHQLSDLQTHSLTRLLSRLVVSKDSLQPVLCKSCFFAEYGALCGLAEDSRL